MNRRTLTPALMIAAGLALVPTAAQAAEPTYVLVAWEVANPASIWESPQVYVTSVMLDAPTLDALDGALPCGTYFQVDLYYANSDSAALVAGGVLYGPNNPTEPLADGAVEGDPWKYVQTAECAVKPELRLFHDERQDVTCDTVTTYSRDGVFDVDFDPVANVWTERAEPTITAEASSVAPNLTPDASCVPVPSPEPTPGVDVLAETGPADGLFWLLGVSTVILGVLLVWIRRVTDTRPRYKRGA